MLAISSSFQLSIPTSTSLTAAVLRRYRQQAQRLRASRASVTPCLSAWGRTHRSLGRVLPEHHTRVGGRLLPTARGADLGHPLHGCEGELDPVGDGSGLAAAAGGTAHGGQGG
jgi:hypothetical protein